MADYPARWSDLAYWEARCRTWQERLRLQAWDVKVKIASREVLPDKGGEVQYIRHTQTAVIRLLDPSQYDPACDFPLDLERTLVHELLHLLFSPLDTEDAAERLTTEEQAVHALSRALVELERTTPAYTTVTLPENVSWDWVRTG